ncbi:hypothetical protein TIFTF001_037891 [Ficus carica]|uniref:Uncharacterized protein n=1 Tax=Ficus carica TaxID=3494 RepID=A0AA88JCK3_FICCA|nr:hypothetical protein TIFTF001_037891 [Ficus carica]
MLSIEFHLRADSELLLMCRALILCKLEIGCTKSSLSPLSFSHVLSLLSSSSPLRCQSNKPIHARSEQALRHARRAGAEFAIVVEQRKAITLLAISINDGFVGQFAENITRLKAKHASGAPTGSRVPMSSVNSTHLSPRCRGSCRRPLQEFLRRCPKRWIS